MSDKDRIMSLIKEAEIYRKQGLFDESKEKFEEVLDFIQHNEIYSKNNKLIDALKTKLRAVEKTLEEVEQDKGSPELSPEVQELIARLFSFSESEDTAAMEGAIALAKFGQYEKALEAFHGLIHKGIMPLVAAKNVLMCHMTLSTPDAAIAQFKQWMSEDEFSAKELAYLRTSLEDALKKQGTHVELPQVVETPAEQGEPEAQEEEIIDISSFTVKLVDGPRKGQMAQFEVTFQSGNKISTIVPSKEKDLANAFKPGLKLSAMECTSPIAVFNARGIVSGMNRITSGPRQGDYSLDITIKSV
jgi:chemotaxis protein histidine kinase CheA